MKLLRVSTLILLVCCVLITGSTPITFINGQQFGESYPLNSSSGALFSTQSSAAIGVKFMGQGIGGTFIMREYLNSEINIYKQFPIVNVTDGSDLSLLGVYSLNFTSAVYDGSDTFFLYMSYFMGVFNCPPESLNLLLLDESNRFVPLPNESRERISVKTVNATFSSYVNEIQNKILYMGIFGQVIVQHSVMDTYVNISYPQIVNYDLDAILNQTLDVYYYDWYGSIPAGKPNRYMMVKINDQIAYPNTSFISLYKYKIIGAPGQANKQPQYNGYGLRNYVFNFNADSLLDYYSKQFNETLKLDTLVCGYQKKSTTNYIDNGRSRVNIKEGSLTCDDTLGDEIESLTIMIQTNKYSPIPPTPSVSTSGNPVDHTIIVAVTASVFGALLLVFGIITIVAVICCMRKRGNYNAIQ